MILTDRSNLLVSIYFLNKVNIYSRQNQTIRMLTYGVYYNACQHHKIDDII
jgi:hypothetical protein